MTDEERLKLTGLADLYKTADIKERNRIAPIILEMMDDHINQLIRTKCHLPDLWDECKADCQSMLFLRALESWDPQKAAITGCSFPTYATFWLLVAVRQTIAFNDGGPVMQPRKASGKRERFAYVYLDHVYYIKDDSQADEAARDFFCYQQGYYDAETPEEVIEIKQTVKKLVEQMKTSLTKRERYVLQELMVSDRTLADIGEELSLTRERVRQIKEMALTRLRKRARRLNA